MDVWGKSAEADLTIVEPDSTQPAVNLDAIKEAAKLIGNAKNPVIIVGGGAQHAGFGGAGIGRDDPSPHHSGTQRFGHCQQQAPAQFINPNGVQILGRNRCRHWRWLAHVSTAASLGT